MAARGRPEVLSVAVPEKAAIDLALTIFEIDTIHRAVQVAQLALGCGGSAQGAGDLLQLLKHGKPLSVYLPSMKIGEEPPLHQSRLLPAAMRKAHSKLIPAAPDAYL